MQSSHKLSSVDIDSSGLLIHSPNPQPAAATSAPRRVTCSRFAAQPAWHAKRKYLLTCSGVHIALSKSLQPAMGGVGQGAGRKRSETSNQNNKIGKASHRTLPYCFVCLCCALVVAARATNCSCNCQADRASAQRGVRDVAVGAHIMATQSTNKLAGRQAGGVSTNAAQNHFQIHFAAVFQQQLLLPLFPPAYSHNAHLIANAAL